MMQTSWPHWQTSWPYVWTQVKVESQHWHGQSAFGELMSSNFFIISKYLAGDQCLDSFILC